MNVVCGNRFWKSVHSVLLILSAVFLVGLITAVYLNAGYLADWISAASGIEYSTITILQTAMLLVNLVTIPFCGALTLRFSDFKLFVGGFVLCIAGILGMFFFPSLPGLIIFYVIMFGFGSAVSGYSIALSVILPLIGEKFAGVASAALISCGNAVSLFLFPILQGFVLSAPDGWVFLILAIIGLCLMPLLFYIFKRRQVSGVSGGAAAKKEGVKLRSLAKEVFTSPRFYLLCFLSFSFGAVATSPSGNMIHSLEVYFNVGSLEGSLYLSLFSFIYVVSGIVCGIFVARIHAKMLYMGISFLIIAALHMTQLFWLPLVSTIIFVFCIAFVLGAISPGCALITREWVGAAKFAAVYSPIYLMLRFGGIFSTFFGGMEYALEYSFDVLLSIGEILMIAAATFAIVVGIRDFRKRKQEKMISSEET